MTLHKHCGKDPEYIKSRSEDCCYGLFKCPVCGFESGECEDVDGGEVLKSRAEEQWNIMFEKNIDDPCENCEHSCPQRCIALEPPECDFCGGPDYPVWKLSSRY